MKRQCPRAVFLDCHFLTREPQTEVNGFAFSELSPHICTTDPLRKADKNVILFTVRVTNRSSQPHTLTHLLSVKLPAVPLKELEASVPVLLPGELTFSSRKKSNYK